MAFAAIARKTLLTITVSAFVIVLVFSIVFFLTMKPRGPEGGEPGDYCLGSDPQVLSIYYILPADEIDKENCRSCRSNNSIEQWNALYRLNKSGNNEFVVVFNSEALEIKHSKKTLKDRTVVNRKWRSPEERIVICKNGLTIFDSIGRLDMGSIRNISELIN